MQVIPAINVNSFNELKSRIRLVEPVVGTDAGGFGWVQLDVADGTFTKNTIWHNSIDLLTLETPLKIEVHLMLSAIEEKVEDWFIVPVKRIIAGMLDSMIMEGFLSIQTTRPLRVNVDSKPDFDKLDRYEYLLYESFADDGELSQDELENLMNTAIEKIQEKAWDADVEATIKYYSEQMSAYIEDKLKEPKIGCVYFK